MPASSVKRTPDASGDEIKTFTDNSGAHIQAAALVDENAAQVGTASNPMPVSASALPLPTGAATQATLAALLTELQAKTDPTDTQPVSAAALPLPTGAATEATLAAIQSAARFGGILPNHVDEPDANTIYVGKEDKDGAWLVQKSSKSGTVTTLTYATILNNGAVLTYSAAWAARASTLVYGTFAEAF